MHGCGVLRRRFMNWGVGTASARILDMFMEAGGILGDKARELIGGCFPQRLGTSNYHAACPFWPVNSPVHVLRHTDGIARLALLIELRNEHHDVIVNQRSRLIRVAPLNCRRSQLHGGCRMVTTAEQLETREPRLDGICDRTAFDSNIQRSRSCG